MPSEVLDASFLDRIFEPTSPVALRVALGFRADVFAAYAFVICRMLTSAAFAVELQ